MPRYYATAESAPDRAAPPPPARLGHPVDLISIRLVLRQHLDELRARGADAGRLGRIEAELRSYSETVDDLVRRLRF